MTSNQMQLAGAIWNDRERNIVRTKQGTPRGGRIGTRTTLASRRAHPSKQCFWRLSSGEIVFIETENSAGCRIRGVDKFSYGTIQTTALQELAAMLIDQHSMLFINGVDHVCLPTYSIVTKQLHLFGATLVNKL